MLEVKILLSDLNYDDVADLVVPLVSDRLAAKGGLIGKIAGKKDELLKAVHKFLSQKDQDERDQFLAELVTKKRSLILEKAADFAEKKGVKVQICDISVKKNLKTSVKGETFGAGFASIYQDYFFSA